MSVTNQTSSVAVGGLRKSPAGVSALDLQLVIVKPCADLHSLPGGCSTCGAIALAFCTTSFTYHLA